MTVPQRLFEAQLSIGGLRRRVWAWPAGIPGNLLLWCGAWIAVDVVGVPLLVSSHFYPSAVLYAVYGGLVLWGFVVWLKASRAGTAQREPEAVTAA